MHSHTIETLKFPVSEADLSVLALLLVDAVESGGAVSFVLPFSRDQALAWWRQVASNGESNRGPTILVARDGANSIVGSVQVHRSWAPNQLHRGDIAKLLVHRSARNQGLGRRLMLAAEEAARAVGLTLLVLDCKSGGAAERLYRSLGWVHAGTIPNYALDPDGRAFHATEYFFKELGAKVVCPS